MNLCSCARDEASDTLVVRVEVMAEPSTDLLDRALAGWERFLGTFAGARDE